MITGSTKFRPLTPEALAMLGAPRMVYIREVDPAELRADGSLPPHTRLPKGVKLYAVHAANGERMAVLDDRDAAFVAAREQEMEPVSVH